jgi:rSAM/selenodomain-associated transferase 2
MSILSIIIPVFNEAEQIQTTIAALLEHSEVELIVVDGGSGDRTVERVESLGITAISSERGRAHQMNAGAAIATGEVLLFLHADTRLPVGYREAIEKTLSQPQVVAGAFTLTIDGRKPALRWIEKMVDLRSRLLSLPYGDQGIFLEASRFRELGGFAPIPILEDFELIGRLKQRGKIAIVPQSVVTSGRRWEKLGIWRTTAINQAIILGYYLGFSPEQLARWYGRR